MENNKNLYDYTSQELKDKMAHDFDKEYDKYYYKEEQWNELLKIIDEFNSTILETGFPHALFTETKYKLSQVPSIKKAPSSAEVIFDNIVSVITKVGKSIYFVFDTIKFVFSILGLTFASFAITMFLYLLTGSFIYGILPDFVTEIMLLSFVSSILFIVFKVLIFIDKDDRNVLNNPKAEVIKFACTIPFYCAIFFIFKNIDSIPALETVSKLFYPHLWLTSFTGDYVFSPMIALTVNCLLSIVIYLIIRKRSNY